MTIRKKPLIRFISLNLMLLGPLVLTQCRMVKNLWLLESGSVKQEEFQTTLDYEYQFGVIIVKSKIDGETYRFILDSGAPSIGLNDSVASTLDVEQKSTVEAGDTHGKSNDLPLVKLDHISLGGVQFKNMAAFVSRDLQETFPFKCMDIDGIIGTNLMKEAVWQIDFRDTQIHIADHQSKLPDPEPAYTFPMDNGFQDKPKFTTNSLGDQKILLDLGSNGGLQVERGNHKTLKNSLDLQYTDSAKRIGVSSFGLYGGAVDTMKEWFSDSFSLNGMPVTPLSIRPSDEHILGLDFLQNYRLTLNWRNEEIGFTPYEQFQKPQNLVGVGFDPMYDGEALVIKTIYQSSSAWNAGLRYRDTIVAVLSPEGENQLPEDNCGLAKERHIGQGTNPDKLREGVTYQMVTKRDGIKDTFDLSEVNDLY